MDKSSLLDEESIGESGLCVKGRSGAVYGGEDCGVEQGALAPLSERR